MLAAQSPLSGHHLIPPPKSSRRPPLHLKNNNLSNTTNSTPNSKPHPHPQISNKENIPIESFDSSLPDELSAIHEKLKRHNLSTTTTPNVKSTPHPEICNKENVPPSYSAPVKIEPLPFDMSLADELSAIREKLERQRVDKEKNDMLLRERCMVLDLQLKQIVNRGEEQKQLEIEVDRLYRLKEIRLASMRISWIRSLRDKEQEKKMNHDRINEANVKIEEVLPLQTQNPWN